MSTLSVIMITQDCERTLQMSLESVKSIADEIIVVDSGSTDHTLEIAKNYTDKVHSMDWPGFGVQKQRALAKATGDWVLSLDSDEVLTAKLAAEIKLSISAERFDAYKIRRLMVFAGRVISHCDRDLFHLRLFRRQAAHFSDDKVHERIIFSGDFGKLKESFYHYSYASIENWMDKMNQYTSISVDQKRVKHKKSSVSKAIFSSIFTFIKFYFIKRGFLDGRIGFVVAMNWAAGNYYKYIKLALDDDFSLKTDL